MAPATTYATPGRPSAHSDILVARRMTLCGRVQGLGVRPAIFRLATEIGLWGTVRNTSQGVVIEIEGTDGQIDQFEVALLSALPPAACVSHLASDAVAPQGLMGFSIVKEVADGPLSVRVPQDRAVCSQCLQEIFDRHDRRFRYPLTSCTRCGPRYTVIRAMPFEREDTTLAAFEFCDHCLREYRQPGNRRFHAQTTACPKCGPQIWSVDDRSKTSHHGLVAMRTAVAALGAGKIVALRGLGGYQLLVDATNQAAVERLRARKGRPTKPLAVMVDSPETAGRLAFCDDVEMDQLTSAAAPIVLVRARSDNGLAPALHPELDAVGLMLPTTPLHAILARDFGRPVVCTSGNRDGDPLEFKVESAQRNLEGICDLWLHHDRPIVRPIDDSVVRVITGRPVTVRLARGLSPLALNLPPMPPTLAVGGYLKAAVAWSNGEQAILAPHIGDQESLAARERYVEHLEDWQALYRFQPARLVHDLHPEYFSTQWAIGQSLPLLGVQHHHAHVVGGMLEHGWLDRKALGVAWDGTGYGTDGTIWGGEFLACTARSFERLARLRPFRLPGGEAAIREPWRIAAAICRQLDEPIDRKHFPAWGIDADRFTLVGQILDRPHLSPLTSSAGRLFDAAAVFILGMTHADYDGQAAMRLEAAADRTAEGSYEIPLRNGALPELDWRPLFAQLLADRRRRVEPRAIAMRFHRSMAAAIVAVCRLQSDLPVVLTGGVFQNRLLTELVVEMWGDKTQSLGLPGIIPPNDGGLAAGQLAIAAAKGDWLSCA